MVKQDLINQVSECTGIGLYEAECAVVNTIEAITMALQKGDQVTIRGFGTFKVVQAKARSVRDINNGKQYVLASRKVVKFKPGKNLINLY